MHSSIIEKLITLFSRFPGIGPRTATRFAFYCLNAKKEEMEELINTLKSLKDNVKLCSFCFKAIEGEKELCSICNSTRRDRETICVVEKETDLLSIEKTDEYNGLYFILGGTVSPLRKKDIKSVRVEELKERIINHKKFNLPKIREIIIATNQNTEGEATAIFIARILSSLNVKYTRLGRGLSTGSELEYADDETLSFALRGRK